MGKEGREEGAEREMDGDRAKGATFTKLLHKTKSQHRVMPQ
jgi:hypothetical protein